jgi:hypothetical protein
VDLGAPISYLVLPEGTDVFSSDEVRIGEVAHVLADVELDILEGIVIDSATAPGGHRFADVSFVESIHERGVVLNVDATAAERLPEPSENPAVVETGPDELAPDDLGDKLGRAWDRIAGRS